MNILQKRFKCVIVPHNTGQIRHFILTQYTIDFLIILAFIIAGVMFFLTLNFIQSKKYALELEQQQRENTTLRANLAITEQTVEGIRDSLNHIIVYNKRVRIMNGIDEISDDTWQVGIGGVIPKLPLTSSEQGVLQEDTYERVDNLFTEVNLLNRQGELLERSSSEVVGIIERRDDLLLHTPSIQPCNGFIASGFGMRRDPFTRGYSFHSGLDIANSLGTPIIAPADGIVLAVDRGAAAGNCILVDHGYGITTFYAHCSIILVEKGEKVFRGKRIACVGNTGRVTGPHLHYEIRVNTKHVDPLNYILWGTL